MPAVRNGCRFPTETQPSKIYCPSGSPDALVALVNAGAAVSSEDKDGLTGEDGGGLEDAARRRTGAATSSGGQFGCM